MKDYPPLITFVFSIIAGICWYFGSYNAALLFFALALLMLFLMAVVERDI